MATHSRRTQPRQADQDRTHITASIRPVAQPPDSPSSIYSSISQRSSDRQVQGSIWERRGRRDNFTISPLSPPQRGHAPANRVPQIVGGEEERRWTYSAPPSATSFPESPNSSFRLSEDEMNLWPVTTIRPRAQSQRRATFDDEEDIGLFAQAVAGFDRPRSPVEDVTTPRGAPPRQTSAQTQQTWSRSRQQHPGSLNLDPEPLRFPGNDRTYLNPPFQPNRESRSMPIPLPSPEPINEALPPQYSPHTFSNHLSTRYAQGSLMDHSLFVQATTGLMPDMQTTDDDDLPDYAQSQMEMAQRRRREGLMRAAELERRWAEASGRHR